MAKLKKKMQGEPARLADAVGSILVPGLKMPAFSESGEERDFLMMTASDLTRALLEMVEAPSWEEKHRMALEVADLASELVETCAAMVGVEEKG